MDDSVNLAYFSDPSVVLDYARAAVNVGLWASEKALFEKYLSKNATILELGCGAGRVAFGLAKLGYSDLFADSLTSGMTCSLTGKYCRRNYSEKIPSVTLARCASSRCYHIGIVATAERAQRHLEKMISVVKVIYRADRIVKMLVGVVYAERVIAVYAAGRSEVRHKRKHCDLSGISVGLLEVFKHKLLVDLEIVGYLVNVKSCPERNVVRLVISPKIDRTARDSAERLADVLLLHRALAGVEGYHFG